MPSAAQVSGQATCSNAILETFDSREEANPIAVRASDEKQGTADASSLKPTRKIHRRIKGTEGLHRSLQLPQEHSSHPDTSLKTVQSGALTTCSQDLPAQRVLRHSSATLSQPQGTIPRGSVPSRLREQAAGGEVSTLLLSPTPLSLP